MIRASSLLPLAVVLAQPLQRRLLLVALLLFDQAPERLGGRVLVLLDPVDVHFHLGQLAALPSRSALILRNAQEVGNVVV